MNTLVIRADEMSGEDRAIVRGDRARQFYDEQQPVPGQPIRVAVMNSFRADAKIESAAPDQLTLTLESRYPAPGRLPLSLFVAVPRPQTVKKVISLAAQAGIESLYFVRSFHTVPSYLQSHSLRDADIESEVIKGLQQVWDCVAPKVEVIDRMGRFFEDILPGLKQRHPKAQFFLGEPLSENTRSLSSVFSQGSDHTVLGIGPEKGWSSSEQEGFTKAGFSLIHLGDREFRVETALAFFIGQLQLLAESRL